MDAINQFRAKLDLLDSMLIRLRSTQARVVQLRRNVFVLKALLRGQTDLPSPYGPATFLVSFSRQ